MINRKYSILILSFWIAAAIIAFAQDTKGKVWKYTRKADIELYNNNFMIALDLYQKAYRIDTNNARTTFKLGSCMYSIKKNKPASLPYFEKAQKAGIAEANYYLGNLYHLQGKFEDAIQAFQNYMNPALRDKKSPIKKEFSNQDIDFLITKSKTAMELEKTRVNVTIENMGSTINSEYPDYVPVISADESVLIFTSRRKESTQGLLDPYGDYFEDVYISNKKEGNWTVPQSISKNINTPTHDASVGLSPDGELLFLYRTSEDFLSGDLYFSVFNGTDWLLPTKLPAPINTPDYTEPSASLSADGNTLYFSSNRPGGFGKKDIYKIVKLPGGDWSKAINMGPVINTFEDEDSPFIHPNGKILYFSSKAHKNMGGYDIFKTTFNAEGNWSQPENIGYPVNTPDDDIYFVLSTDGQTGYYSSDRAGGFGGTDIYLIHFIEENFGLGVFKGKVISVDSTVNPFTDKITLTVVAADSANKPLSATITLLNAATNQMEGIYKTNPLTGKFIMIFSKGKEYILTIESEGYDSFTSKMNLSDSEEKINKIRLRKSGK